MWKMNITEKTAEESACRAWGENLDLEDLMKLYEVTIDMDAIQIFNDKLKTLDEGWERLNAKPN